MEEIIVAVILSLIGLSTIGFIFWLINYEVGWYVRIPKSSKISKEIKKNLKKRARDIKKDLARAIKNNVDSNNYYIRANSNDDLALEYVIEDFRKNNWNLKIENGWIKAKEIRNSEVKSQEPKQRIYR